MRRIEEAMAVPFVLKVGERQLRFPGERKTVSEVLLVKLAWEDSRRG
jgi:hypothetical protein